MVHPQSMSCLELIEARDVSLHLEILSCRTDAHLRAPQEAGCGDDREPGSAPLVWTGIALLNTWIPATAKPVQVTLSELLRCKDYRWSFAGSSARPLLEIRQIECFLQERRHVGWRVCPLVLTMDWLVDLAVDWPCDDVRAARTSALKLNFDRGSAGLEATIRYCPTSSVDRIMNAMMTVEMSVRYRPISLSRDMLIRSMKTAPRRRGLTAARLSPKTSARKVQGRFYSGNEEAGPTGPLPGNYEEKDKQDGACTHARIRRARRRAFSRVERVG